MPRYHIFFPSFVLSSSIACTKNCFKDCVEGFPLALFLRICNVHSLQGKVLLCVWMHAFNNFIFCSHYYALWKDCRHKPHSIESKIPSLIQGHAVSILWEMSGSFISTGARQMHDKSHVGTINTAVNVQQTFWHGNLTFYFSSLVSYPYLCNWSTKQPFD